MNKKTTKTKKKAKRSKKTETVFIKSNLKKKKKLFNKSLKEENINLNIEFLEIFSELAESFDYLQISLTSPEQIKNWSRKSLINTILKGKIGDNYDKLKNLKKNLINFVNYEGLEPFPTDMFSLFAEEIFGPINNWRCKCKKYKYTHNKNAKIIGIICPICKVEVIASRVRRYRVSYIDLCMPIIHTWYVESLAKLVHVFLNLILPEQKQKELQHNNEIFIEIVNQKELIRNDDDNIEIINTKIKNIIFEPDFIEDIYSFNLPSYYLGNLSDFFNDVKIFFKKYFNFYSTKIGPEFLLDFLKQVDFLNLLEIIEKKDNFDSNTIFYLRLLKNFISTQSRLDWLILTNLPILPPATRPFIKNQKNDNAILASGLTNFYQNICKINLSCRIMHQKIYTKNYADEISNYAQKLQIAVDQLIDNSRLPEDLQIKINNQTTTSLTEGLEGKFGRFRYNMLGKRVNFSGRSVIVTGPTLHLYQCKLPYKIALTLFSPHLIDFLQKQMLEFLSKIEIQLTTDRIDWKNLITIKSFYLYKILGNIVKEYLILLNRAPTLHRFNIQSFTPLLCLTKVISLHPLVCTGFNADFDGDQMAVHLPLYNVSQLESRLLSSPQVLTPANGDVILKPSQDMVIGCCYLSIILEKNRNIFFKYFDKKEDVYLAHSQKIIDLHMPILLNLILNKFHIIKIKNNLILKSSNLDILDYKIEIIKFVRSLNFLYLFLNCGILVLKVLPSEKYRTLNFFIKTTPGRIFFGDSINVLFETNKKYKKYN